MELPLSGDLGVRILSVRQIPIALSGDPNAAFAPEADIALRRANFVFGTSAKKETWVSTSSFN
jgi:hypothetical protein